LNQVVIGMAGHIDHGKTSLVKALTGTNTDNLEEELRRGMTIDLGFAFLNEEITLIDVPGHEKFVKNMMAGASGIDGAILVIAADDGIMPQTKEHFEILNLLGIKSVIIALNKIDIADSEWIELVEMEIQELLFEAGIDDFSIIQVSAIQNKGIDKLKTAIIELSQTIPSKIDNGIFRLPVDRVFTIQGFGTVVTGTVQSGSIKVGQEVEIIPGNLKVKVRGIQSHETKTNQVYIGDRAAINFQGLDKNSVKRGYQCLSIGYLLSTKEFGANIINLRNSKVEIKQNQRVRIHLGTQEVMGRISILDKKRINSGENATVIIKLEESLVATMNDKFIIRRFSPVVTIGGGQVIDAHLFGKWSEKKKYLNLISHFTNDERIISIIQYQGVTPIDKKNINTKFGINEKLLKEKISQFSEVKYINDKNEIWLVTEKQLNTIDNQIINILEVFQKKNRLKPGALSEEIYQQIGGNKKFIENRLISLEFKKMIKRSGEFWSTTNFKVQFSDEENKLYNKIILQLNNEGFQSSNISDFSNISGVNEHELIPLIKIGEMKNEIIRLTETLMFTQNNFDLLKQKMVSFLLKNKSISISEFKDLAKTSRKYAVPLLEYFDRKKITYRDGNERKLLSK
jgi:selenocysteine-specific elongation factor